jgi:hypothetical protein
LESHFTNDVRNEGDSMTIFRVERYVVKPEKSGEYHAIIKRFTAYIKKNKEKCKELKSWKLFSQMLGNNVGEFMEMWELDSLADYEKLMNRIMQDKEFQTVASEFYKDCLMPATYSVNIWSQLEKLSTLATT